MISRQQVSLKFWRISIIRKESPAKAQRRKERTQGIESLRVHSSQLTAKELPILLFKRRSLLRKKFDC
jgi:hypothetical protein